MYAVAELRSFNIRFVHDMFEAQSAMQSGQERLHTAIPSPALYSHLQILLMDSSRMRVSMPSSSPGLRRVGGCFASGFSDTCLTCCPQLQCDGDLVQASPSARCAAMPSRNSNGNAV